MSYRNRLCEACNLNPVRGPHSIRCESCAVALRKANQLLAAYRHRQKVKEGKARHNKTYGGRPTQHAVNQAMRVLLESGIIQMPKVPGPKKDKDDDEDSEVSVP